ncbi:MAG: hypothetical protein EA381_06655 [Planctomycetaceae bacterium]|nr:MAG: hypothetical protein EA381_06655 [Planctomycetaceae bacterium]
MGFGSGRSRKIGHGRYFRTRRLIVTTALAGLWPLGFAIGQSPAPLSAPPAARFPSQATATNLPSEAELPSRTRRPTVRPSAPPTDLPPVSPPAVPVAPAIPPTPGADQQPTKSPEPPVSANRSPAPTESAGVLPDESVWLPEWLRRQQLPETSPATAMEPMVVTLPDESVLASAPTPPPASDNTPTDPNSDPQSEAAPQANAGQAGAADAANAGSDTSPGENRPFLRLNYEGPTERVRSIALSSDGQWAVSGGEDKVLQVWQRAADRGWLHRRTIRWQVERGQSGRIQRVAIRDRFAAFAGYGASGGIGEIWIVDVSTGELSRALFDPETAHRQTIAQLAWAPGDQPALLSADVEGRVVVWRPDPQTGLWAGKMLVDRDEVTYGPQRANYLSAIRGFVCAAFVGPDRIVVPKYVGQVANQPRVPLWRLELVPLDGPGSVLLGRSDHTHLVVSLAVSNDSRRIASADGTGRVRTWELAPPVTGSPAAVTIRRVIDLTKPAVSGQTLDLDWDASGRRLLVAYSGGVIAAPGGATTPNPGGGIDLWDFSATNPRRSAALATPAAVFSGSLSATGEEAWISQGNEIRIHRVDPQGRLASQPVQRLATPVRAIREVAFVDRDDAYQVAVRWGDAWETMFDLSRVEIGREAEPDATRLRPAQTASAVWSAGKEQDPAGDRYRLFYGNEPRARLDWKPETHGTPTTIAVIANVKPAAEDQPNEDPATASPAAVAQNAPIALAVGSTFRNNIYVYEAPGERTDQPPRLLRQFRGHSGSIRSLSVSADGRYLTSASDDATIAIWPLGELWESNRLEANWGIDLEETQRGLEVSRAREDGPLFFRGVREGDNLVEIRWADPNSPADVKKLNEPAAILDALQTLPFDTLVVFRWHRRDETLPEFQSYPAWQPLAQLLLGRDREWAMWTPAGIYDASVNGHRRFGWQVNRGIHRLPDFFRADQFRERLERPAVLRRLLERGSLSGALLAAGEGLAPIGEATIVNQLKSRPEIEWLGPDPNRPIVGQRLEVEARIRLPAGADQAIVKLFADGVAASASTRVAVWTEGGRQVEHHRWSVPLVRNPQILVEVVAATPAGAFDRITQVVQRQIEDDEPAEQPRLHLLAVGVGDYRDPQISSLDFAARGAAEIHDLFARLATPVYRFEGTRLLDNDAIRPLWNLHAEGLVERLAGTVRPDDLVLMYLCGHGVRDPGTGRWYFVTADARHNDLMNDRYADCLSFDDLTAFAQLPCRKLAILDSCHSGAVQPVIHTEDLKSALRFLQEDRILTLTASEGHQEAAEDRDARLGRFTSHLIAALEGAADGVEDANWGGGRGTADGVVTLDEVVAYVTRALAEDAQQDGFLQRPTAGPSDYIRALRLPLTSPRQTLTAR